MFPWCPEEIGHISLSIFVAISLLCRPIYRKETEILCMCFCLSEPFSARIDCWFSWSLLNAWQPTDMLCHWALVCNHDSISPGNQGRAREWKNTHQGRAERRAGEQRLARPRGGGGLGPRRWASSYIHLVPRPPWKVQYVWTWETLRGE